jgi:hypothetical protein
MAGDDTDQAAPDPRKERLAAALRENLRRRKAQLRGRRDLTVHQTDTEPTPAGEPAALPSGPAARERT